MKLNHSKIFIDWGMALTFSRTLSDKLRRSGASYKDKYLDEVLRHPALDEKLKARLIKEIEKIVDRNGRKCPRPALRPKKDWRRQFN